MSTLEPSHLALFWAAVIAASILVYVILDGFDLGVGILFGTTRQEPHRVAMMNAVAPFWDGNGTWLIIIAASLFAAFPVVYAVFLGAFYIPVALMLFGLIFRGVAFEFRYRSAAMRKVWDLGFNLGSTLVAFVQGAAIGAMMGGLPVVDEQYAGGSFDWLALFPMITGVGLVLGYALLGAAWLVLKTEGELRDWAYARIPWLVAGVLLVLTLAAVQPSDFSHMAQTHWAERRWALVFPLSAGLALLGVLFGVWKKRDGMPFAMTALFFATAFLTLGVTFWPYMIPDAITVASAAAPEASLSFLFYGVGIFVLPLVAAYTIRVYWIFRGKLHEGYE